MVVTAGGGRDEFRAALQSLRPTLGVHDEVQCVVPAGRPDLGTEAAAHAWLTVAPDTEAAVTSAAHPVVVLLDGDVVVSAHWLDALAEAFTEADVVAAGPRCHRSYGPQGVELPAEAARSAAGLKGYARTWRQHHGGLRQVDRLGPVCAAVRRDELLRVGVDFGYPQLRGRLVVAESALIAHLGSPRCARRLPPLPDSAPLVSGVLIVKDEEAGLAACLSSLARYVDETVVYDTGSTDRTREIAAELGATVVEGYWDEHFGDARNRALAHCRGRWVLSVDADEVLAGDPERVRGQLRAAPASLPSFLVAVDHAGDSGTGVYGRQLFPKLFRRERGCYARRVHEQVVDRVTGEALPYAQLDGLVLAHSGHTVEAVTGRDKAARNLRLAQLSVRDGDAGLAAVGNLARSQLLSGLAEEAAATCREALAGDEGTRQQRATVRQVLVEAYERLGKLADARAAVQELRTESQSPVTADELEARLLFRAGEYAGALALAQAFPERAVDDGFVVVGRDRVAEVEILSLFRLGRYAEAADRLRGWVRAGALPLRADQAAAVLGQAGAGLAELARLTPRTGLRGLLLWAADAPDDRQDELLDALWQEYPGDAGVLAAAARVGGRLPVLRAMEWSARLRGHGFAGHCTLLALAADEGRTARDRALAAAIVVELFGDGSGMPLLGAALERVPEDQGDALLAELRLLAPGVAAAVEPAT